MNPVSVLMGFRKVIISGLVMGCAFTLAMFGKLTGDFAQIAMVALAGFSAANAFEHNAKKAP